MTGQSELPAGRFSDWMLRTLHAQATNDGAEVPCGACTACCRSSYFIHIGPEETKTLSRIPRELLFAAPGLPKGNVVLGYDENGHCPMLIDDTCSIYEHRPITCRNYDCRVFPATGLAPEDDGKTLIAQQVLRWRFRFPTTVDRDQHAAAQAAATFLREHPACFPDGVVPSSSSQLAMLAIKVHAAFLGHSVETGETELVTPGVEAVRAALESTG